MLLFNNVSECPDLSNLVKTLTLNPLEMMACDHENDTKVYQNFTLRKTLSLFMSCDKNLQNVGHTLDVVYL